VIVATHVTAATRILKQSRGVAPELTQHMEHLQTTPVVVVRLWFEPHAEVPEALEAAFTPRADFIDNFFHLNQFDACYDAEGQVIEVHACRGKADESQQDILSRVLKDLSAFCPDLDPRLLKKWVVQPHPDVFTLYAPGALRDRPGNDAGVTGLHLAGDWTRSIIHTLSVKECNPSSWCAGTTRRPSRRAGRLPPWSTTAPHFR